MYDDFCYCMHDHLSCVRESMPGRSILPGQRFCVSVAVWRAKINGQPTESKSGKPKADFAWSASRAPRIGKFKQGMSNRVSSVSQSGTALRPPTVMQHLQRSPKALCLLLPTRTPSSTLCLCTYSESDKSWSLLRSSAPSTQRGQHRRNNTRPLLLGSNLDIIDRNHFGLG